MSENLGQYEAAWRSVSAVRVWSPVSGSRTCGPHRKMPAATLLVVSGLHLSDTILT